MRHDDALSVRADAGRALGPERPNGREPLLEHSTEPPRARVLDRANLLGEAKVTEKRDHLFVFRFEAAIGEPHVKVKYGRRRGKQFNCIEIVRNWVGNEFLIELVTAPNVRW